MVNHQYTRNLVIGSFLRRGITSDRYSVLSQLTGTGVFSMIVPFPHHWTSFSPRKGKRRRQSLQQRHHTTYVSVGEGGGGGGGHFYFFLIVWWPLKSFLAFFSLFLGERSRLQYIKPHLVDRGLNVCPDCPAECPLCFNRGSGLACVKLVLSECNVSLYIPLVGMP